MSAAVPVDRYVLDTLMRDLVGHDRRPAAYLVYLTLLTANQGKPVALSHQQLANKTGLSKRAVQGAVAHLTMRGLLEVSNRRQAEPAIVTPLNPWQR